MNRQLRSDQARALRLLRLSLLGGHRRPMMQAPTGWGKTMLAAAIVDGALAKGNRVLFTVPALSLIDQTVEAFAAEGIDAVGVLQAKHPRTDPDMPVQVASVQTLARRKIPTTDVVVIDEAHRWFDFYGRWMVDPDWARVPFIGLSATPWTRGLSLHFDDLIVAATTAELIAAGLLSRFRVFAPSHPDLRGVRTVAGDFHEGDLSGVMGKAELVADVVKTWLKRGEDRPTLAFAVDRAHARLLEAEFAAAGVATAYVDALTDRDERKRIRAAFHAGTVQVVVNVGVLTTGVDWDVRCIVLARPTKSEMLFVQIIGRGLRTAPGKDHCLILDHSDTTLRLGFVTSIRHDRLDDGRPRPKQEATSSPPIKECPTCKVLMPARAAVCPACGHQARRPVISTKGELVEVAELKATLGRKQIWFSMLLHIAAERGYKRGWAAHQFKQRFGHWPDGLITMTTPPDREVELFVRKAIVSFAKTHPKSPSRVSA